MGVTTAAYGQNTAFMAKLGPLSAPMATWNCHSRSENWFQQVGLDVCYPVPALFQAVPPIQGHHGCLWPEHCIYGQFGASFSPYGHLERPFQVRKFVPAGRPGCVLSRSSLVPTSATHSGSPRLPMARTLHLWPIWGLFQPLWPPGTVIPGPKLVPTGRPGCVLSRSSLVPSCAIHSGTPRLPTARTLHLWPFLALFGHKMGQNGWNKKDMLWIS